MTSAPSILYYGDDFTGATDTLGTAARAGLHALLLLKTPDVARLAQLPALDVLGIAGAARALTPSEMRAELAPIAASFRTLGARVLHYKTCSTFDSAPDIDSIGEACGAVDDPCTVILGGQPNIGRFCLFGNLFAAAGSGGEIFRIDRHPTMSRQPVTPMHEADLRLHLARQGLDGVRSIPFTFPVQDRAAVAHALEVARAETETVLFDIADAGQLAVIGDVLWSRADERTLLAVGPSSVVDALSSATHHVQPEGGAWQADTVANLASVVHSSPGPVLVLAASLSPVTARQVASSPSFDIVWLDAPVLARRGRTAIVSQAQEIASSLAAGRHVLACTRGHSSMASTPLDAQLLARAGGDLLAAVLARVPLRRVGVAGGDTSSHGVMALDAWGLSYVADLGAGASRCCVHSDDTRLDDLEIMLKGGQMGTDDVFERLVHGAGVPC